MDYDLPDHRVCVGYQDENDNPIIIEQNEHEVEADRLAHSEEMGRRLSVARPIYHNFNYLGILNAYCPVKFKSFGPRAKDVRS